MKQLTQCPDCGSELDGPLKSWTMVGKPYNSEGHRMQLSIGIFTCPSCNTRKRVVLNKERVKTVSIEALREMEEKLMETTARKTELERHITELETEKAKLAATVEDLSQRLELAEMETKATTLEHEVESLKTIKESLEVELRSQVSEALDAANNDVESEPAKIAPVDESAPSESTTISEPDTVTPRQEDSASAPTESSASESQPTYTPPRWLEENRTPQ
ncbi:MAG: hypothetical protein ACE5PO_06315 [Candidatus Bathyarchaeia archaeon]